MIRIDGCGAPPSHPPLRAEEDKEGALACRRSTAALAAANERRSSAPATRFLGLGRSARSRWFERPRAFLAGVTRSFLSQSSGVSRRPVILPAGRISQEPPENGSDEPPPAGTALAPPVGVTDGRPFTGARFVLRL